MRLAVILLAVAVVFLGLAVLALLRLYWLCRSAKRDRAHMARVQRDYDGWHAGVRCDRHGCRDCAAGCCGVDRWCLGPCPPPEHAP